jgi:hypothetical protein
MALASLATASLGCHGSKACPTFKACVTSQAEADEANAGSGCDNYVVCDFSEGGNGDAEPSGDGGSPGDGTVGDVGGDVGSDAVGQ